MTKTTIVYERTSEPSGDLENWITRELIEEEQVALMASCPSNSSGHLATGIGDLVRSRINRWMIEEFDQTGNTKVFQKRIGEWDPIGERTKDLIAAIAETIYDHYSKARREREEKELKNSGPC